MSDQSILNIVTDQILSALESGIVPWQQPWTDGVGPHRNLVRKSPYTGINTMILAVSAWESGFDSAWWLTSKDAKKLGGRIKSNCWAAPTRVVFYRERWYHPEYRTWAKQELVRNPQLMRSMGYQSRLILRYYNIYNLNQCEGITAPDQGGSATTFEPIQKAESIWSGMAEPPEIRFEGARAFYAPHSDLISIPRRESFRSEEFFYATLFHELIHSTGHENRLNREAVANTSHFASEDYSKEELTAEIGSAMLCMEAGIVPDWKNSASYVSSWLKALKQDRRWILYGAAKAQAAVNFILVE